MKKLSILFLLSTSFNLAAEEYQWFSDVNYTQNEIANNEVDTWSIGSRYFFDKKSTLGPLREFEFINRTSNVFGAYSDYDVDSSVALGGEYFFDKFSIGATANDDDGIQTVNFSYFFADNFKLGIVANDSNDETVYGLYGQYEVKLEGNDYLGFNFSVDEDFDIYNLSSRYFTSLGNDRYFAASLGVVVTDEQEFWSAASSYYFSSKTALDVSLSEGGNYSVGVHHFFNKNLSFSVSYSEFDPLEQISLRLAHQL